MATFEIKESTNDDFGFIKWAQKEWVTKKQNRIEPIRRVLSLMRMEGCENFVKEDIEWSEETCNEKCQSSYPGSPVNCAEYSKNLIKKYGYTSIHKRCTRLSFFKTKFTEENFLDSTFSINSEDDFLGYCIIHKDTLWKIGSDDPDQYSYITECTLKVKYTKERLFNIGMIDTDVFIGCRKFTIKGNYFTQQNALTNCCANAAIKMAFKSLDKSLSAEQINRAVGIDHISRKCTGISPEEIRIAVENATGRKSFLLKSTDINPLSFMKLIYQALECRFPVILIITSLKNGDIALDHLPENKNIAHAITFIGHTFNEHSWWSYAIKWYFATNKKIDAEYLPSFLWCDNFIVQDDNMGPYYSLPVRLLYTLPTKKHINLFREHATSKGKSGKLRSFASSRMSDFCKYFNIFKSKLTNQIEQFAIISYPEEYGFFRETAYNVEFAALSALNQIVDGIIRHGEEFSGIIDEDFDIYFLNHHKEKSLILRSLAIGKEKYLDSIPFSQKTRGEIQSIVNQDLPETLWCIEISVPELFWTNKHKVGELIIDPDSLKDFLNDESNTLGRYVIFGYLPKLAFKYESVGADEKGYPIRFFPLPQEKIHYQLTTC